MFAHLGQFCCIQGFKVCYIFVLFEIFKLILEELYGQRDILVVVGTVLLYLGVF